MMLTTRIRDNIKYRFIAGLMMGSIIISVSSFVYNYHNNKILLENKAKKNADLITERLSKNLVIPMWEVDEEWVGMIADTEILADDVKAICIMGEGDLNVCRQRSKEGDIIKLTQTYAGDYFMQRRAPIIHKEQEIGEVKIFFTDSFLKQELARELMANVYLATLIIFFLILAPMIILDRIVLNPLNKILAVVRAEDQGNALRKVEVAREDQIGLLGKEFNNMIDNIKQKEKMMLIQSRHAAMGEMISMIAHQWRQPITAIAMGANNIIYDTMSGKSDPKLLQEVAEKIVEQTIHLGKTVDDFKNFFSPDKKREYVNVSDVLENTFSVLEKSLEVNNVKLIKKYEQVDKVSIFPRELLQVVLNIVNNAKEALVEFKPEEPTIEVILNQDKENVYISVCNNGPAIEKDVMDRIFEPYFTTKDQNGTGLGLYMSKTIIERHFRGSIDVKNQEESGVCFFITFPKQ